MTNLTNDIDDAIIKRANNIINTWLLKSVINRNNIEPINVTNTELLIPQVTLRKRKITEISLSKNATDVIIPDPQEQSIYIL